MIAQHNVRDKPDVDVISKQVDLKAKSVPKFWSLIEGLAFITIPLKVVGNEFLATILKRTCWVDEWQVSSKKKKSAPGTPNTCIATFHTSVDIGKGPQSFFRIWRRV